MNILSIRNLIETSSSVTLTVEMSKKDRKLMLNHVIHKSYQTSLGVNLFNTCKGSY